MFLNCKVRGQSRQLIVRNWPTLGSLLTSGIRNAAKEAIGLLFVLLIVVLRSNCRARLTVISYCFTSLLRGVENAGQA